MEKTFKVVKLIKVTIPDNKIEEYLKDFNEIIDETGDATELLKHIAWNVAFGDSFVEGVGRVLENGVDWSVPNSKEFKAHDINTIEEDRYCEEA